MPTFQDLTGKTFKNTQGEYLVVKRGPNKLGGAGDTKTTWVCKEKKQNKLITIFTKNLKRMDEIK